MKLGAGNRRTWYRLPEEPIGTVVYINWAIASKLGIYL
jgi:hypothetical protein